MSRCYIFKRLSTSSYG